MFVKSLSRYAFFLGSLFVLENGFCQSKPELPAEVYHLAAKLSQPVANLKNEVERPVSASDIPARTFHYYETSFFILKKPDSSYLFGSPIRKIMISVGNDSTLNGIFITLSNDAAFWKTASEKLGAESGKWNYENSFGLSGDSPQSPYHIWNIESYIISIFNSNDYDRTPAEDRNKYVLTIRKNANL